MRNDAYMSAPYAAAGIGMITMNVSLSIVIVLYCCRTGGWVDRFVDVSMGSWVGGCVGTSIRIYFEYVVD